MAERQNNQFTSMFRDLGIDTRSEDQILQEQAQLRAQRAMALEQQRPPTYRGEQDLRMAGNALGALIGGKLNPPQLSPEQKMWQEAQKYADDRIKLMEQGDAFGSREEGTYNATVAGETRLEKMAEYLLNKGDMRGLDIAGQVYNARQMRERDKEAREKFDLEQRTGEHDLEESKWKFDRDKFIATRGELTTVYPVGSNDPNSGRMAFVDDFGFAHTQSNGEAEMIPLGEYVVVRPDDPTKSGGSNDAAMTPSEKAKMQAQQRSIMQQLRLSNIMVDAMATAIEESGDGTLDIMDGAGKFQTFTTNLANNINAVMRQGEKWVGLVAGDPEDPNAKVVGRVDGSIGSSMKYVQNNLEWANEFIPIPDGIEAGTTQAMRYQAAIVQLAYAKARSNEPGARQLSDNDFKNAIKQIGADATSPDTFRQVMLDNVGTAHADFEFWRKQVGDEVYFNVIQRPAHEEYIRELNKFNDRFEAAWGTAANPRGAITEPPETDYRDEDGNPREETYEERRQRLLKR